MFSWLNTLFTRSKRPLDLLPSEVTSLEDVLELVEAVRNEAQKQKRDNAELRLEWGEMLDKLTRLANRAAARERMRTKRALAVDDDDEPDDAPAPAPNGPAADHPQGNPPPQLDVRFMTKPQLRALAARGSHNGV